MKNIALIQKCLFPWIIISLVDLIMQALVALHYEKKGYKEKYFYDSTFQYHFLPPKRVEERGGNGSLENR